MQSILPYKGANSTCRASCAFSASRWGGGILQMQGTLFEGFKLSGDESLPVQTNVNLVLLNPLILKCARGPGRNNKALGIKYAKSGLVFFGGV